ncbi:site-specific integrase [Streptomyces sp. NBC_01431]|uniref:site-specific integrase n=1 Tax=Streptomyces sp. NBC_01431 TaxID=2903863 RepID=UPI002E36EF65|nr:site-specific integrase [Streptomyces sp. NBC_01431]
MLLSLMGLRPAEVCGLRWEDVDLENATIDIANTRTMIGNGYVVEKDTKSLAGERALPLPTPVLDALKAFRALQAEERLALGEAYVVSGYVLVHETGVAFTIKQIRRRAYRLMELLGLRRVRLYLARAACFTYLANRGVHDHILARWAGHKNVKTTKRWYVKPDVEDLRGAATAWEGLHGPARGGGGGASMILVVHSRAMFSAPWSVGLRWMRSPAADCGSVAETGGSIRP